MFSYGGSEHNLHVLRSPRAGLLTHDAARQDPDGGPPSVVAPRPEETVVLVEDETQGDVRLCLPSAVSFFGLNSRSFVVSEIFLLSLTVTVFLFKQF